MPERHLRETLDELHRELSATEEVDPESRAHLRRTLQEIQEVLDREREAPESHSLADRLEDAYRHFEADHPTLGASIRRVVNALSNLGI